VVYTLLADLVLVVHLAIVVFALLGGALVLRHPKVLWVHLPVLLWGVVVEWADWICPLTPLENYFLHLGGKAGYTGDFVARFVSRVLYPEHLTLSLRYVLGLILIAVNVVVYGYVILRRRRTA
jgi:Protein of Unknown function (DUF2784)